MITEHFFKNKESKLKISLKTVFEKELELVLKLPVLACSCTLPDGTELVTNIQDVIYMRCCMDPFLQLRLPGIDYTVVKRSYFPSQHKGSSVSVTRAVVGAMYFDILDELNIETPLQAYRLGLTEAIPEAIQTLWNKIVVRKGLRYLSSVDILDYHALTCHPTLKAMIDQVAAGNMSLSELEVLTENFSHFMYHEAPKTNPLVRRLLDGSINVSQLRKVILVAGRRRQVTGKPIHYTVSAGFYQGLPSIVDFAIETTMGRAAAAGIGGPLKMVGAAIRRLQHETHHASRVIHGDCGSRKTVPWLVRGPEKDENGKTTYSGDLPHIESLNRIDETGETVTIKKSDTFLIGQVVQLRSIMTCQHSDPHAVCSECFGKLYRNMNPFANIGVMYAMMLFSKVFQLLLSGKHDTKDSQTSKLRLSNETGKYFVVGKSGLTFNWKGIRSVKTVHLVCARDEVTQTLNLFSSPSLKDLEPSRSSRLKRVVLQIDTGLNTTTIAMDVTDGSRKSYFTADMLDHIGRVGMRAMGANEVLIDITTLPSGFEMFMVPDRTLEIDNIGKVLLSLLEGTVKVRSARHQTGSPVATLTQMFDIMAQRDPVHLQAFMVVLYSMMTYSQTDYRMARGSPDPVLGTAQQVSECRSVPHTLALRAQAATLLSSRAALPYGKTSTIADVAYCPNAVLRARGRKT